MSEEPRIHVYVSQWCAECERAVALLERHHLAFDTTHVGDPADCCRLHELTGGASVPQVGGYADLAALIHGGLPVPSNRKGLAP